MTRLRHAFAVLLTCAPGALFAQKIPGWSIVSRFSVDSGRGAAWAVTMAMEASGDRLRVQVNSTSPAAAQGMYMIFDGATGTIINVLPATRTSMVMDLSGPMTGLAAMVKTSLKGEPTIEVEDLGAGEAILGAPTHRYHSRTVYTMVSSIGDVSCEKTESSDEFVWMTPNTATSVSVQKAMRGVVGGRWTQPAMTSLYAMRQKKMPGIELRQSGVVKTVSSTGDSSSVRVTYDVTTFGEVSLDADRLAAPPDFEIMDMRETMRDMDPAMVSSALVDAMRRSICGGKAAKP